MIDVRLALDRLDYENLDKTNTTNVSLTQQQAQILLSVSVLLLERRAWSKMSDTQWDDLEYRIAEAIDELHGAS